MDLLDKARFTDNQLKFTSERRFAVALDLLETTANGNDKDTLYTLGIFR
jgi:hypothetical protein